MKPTHQGPLSPSPLALVRAVFERAAAQRNCDLSSSELRILTATLPRSRALSEEPVGLQAASSALAGSADEPPGPLPAHAPATEGPWTAARVASDTVEDISPFDLGRQYELALAPQVRQRAGAHLTPQQVARQLVAMMPVPAPGDTILDPAVGGAAFLLAAADRLVAAGASPATALHQLHGYDIDPGAVAVAEAALALWAVDHGVAPVPLPNLVVGDGLLDALPRVNHIVGNPPFLNQLRKTSSHTADRRARLRKRWGDLIGTYTDDAWLFVAAGLEALAPGGSLAMVQPLSILAARDASAIRALVHRSWTLTGLWVARDRVFDAAVHVCGIVVSEGADLTRPLERCVGADFDRVRPLVAQPATDEWGSAAAATLNVPAVHLPRSEQGVVADLASATAGFRDQFYGFVPFVADSDAAPAADFPRLVTVGMIDVLGLSWGEREFRFAKRRFVRPVIDVHALAEADRLLGEWTRARLRPKLLMATQTRVVEVWVDDDGHAVPATPVVSIEPHDDDPATRWLLAAALSAPAVSATMLAAKFGTAMALNSMKIAARDVLGAPLPSDQGAWSEAAELLRSQPESLADYAALMGRAYGATDPELQTWWLERATNGSKRS